MELRDVSIAAVGDAVRAYAGTLAMVAASTLLGLWIAPRWGTAPVDMIYLPAVLGAAALWGLGPGLVAGIISALAYNFFFTAPVHTLRIDRVADIVTVSVLLIVALVTGRLAAGIRKQAQIADAHAARNAVIAGFARRLLSCGNEEEIPRLTAIGSAVRELRRSGSGDRQLISSIGNEASQLDRYIANLLDLGEDRDEQPIEAGGVTIELFHRRVSKDGQQVRLTPKEFAV